MFDRFHIFIHVSWTTCNNKNMLLTNDFKVHVFWEGHKILVIWKIWHYLPNGFDATKGLKKFFNLDEISKKVPSHFPDHYMSTKVLKKRCLIRGVICHLSFWDLSPSENIYEIKSSVSTLDFQISRRIL